MFSIKSSPLSKIRRLCDTPPRDCNQLPSIQDFTRYQDLEPKSYFSLPLIIDASMVEATCQDDDRGRAAFPGFLTLSKLPQVSWYSCHSLANLLFIATASLQVLNCDNLVMLDGWLQWQSWGQSCENLSFTARLERDSWKLISEPKTRRSGLLKVYWRHPCFIDWAKHLPYSSISMDDASIARSRRVLGLMIGIV